CARGEENYYGSLDYW
nr:immunoglobulin heavy chain junction region [Mus musculus]